MRYSADHKAETRRRLIEHAGQLAKKNGFATTGVDGLMASVGLTGGAFYSHFSSKDELLKDIIETGVRSTRMRLTSQEGGDAKTALQQLNHFYLSPKHIAHPELGCPLPSLSTEVARSNDEIKQSYESEVKKIQQVLAGALGNDQTAWATLALSVGAVSIARAMFNSDTQRELLESCKALINQSLEQLPNTDISPTESA